MTREQLSETLKDIESRLVQVRSDIERAILLGHIKDDHFTQQALKLTGTAMRAAEEAAQYLE